MGRKLSRAEQRAARRRKRERKRKLRRIIPWLTLLLGLALVAYPILTDMLYAWKASEVINGMEEEVDYENDPVRLEQLAQAQAFNALLGNQEPEIPVEDVWPYEQQLTWQTPYMGYLDIPRIDVSIPVFHDTNDTTLAEGAGHIAGTSLPVGGVPSNCCISAHSGLRTARMFDDVRKLQEGDKICLHVLNDPYAYEVYDIETVLPDEIEHLGIYEADTDMLTLITCTPMYINDHRLLVHCKRIPYDPSDFETVPVDAYLNSRTIPPLVIGFILALSSAIVIFVGWLLRRRKKRKKEEEEKRKTAEAAALESGEGVNADGEATLLVGGDETGQDDTGTSVEGAEASAEEGATEEATADGIGEQA